MEGSQGCLGVKQRVVVVEEEFGQGIQGADAEQFLPGIKQMYTL